MAKTKAPAPKPEAPTTEAPAVDLSEIRNKLQSNLEGYFESSDKADECQVDMVLDLYEHHTENPEVERSTYGLLIREAIAELRGLKPEQIEKAPVKGTHPNGMYFKNREEWTKRNGAYTLAGELLKMVWPKREDEQRKVAKAIADGERRFVTLKKLASKPQGNPKGSKDKNKVTKDTFTEWLKAQLTKAAADMGESLDEILDLVSTTDDDSGALSVIRAEHAASEAATAATEGEK